MPTICLRDCTLWNLRLERSTSSSYLQFLFGIQTAFKPRRIAGLISDRRESPTDQALEGFAFKACKSCLKVALFLSLTTKILSKKRRRPLLETRRSWTRLVPFVSNTRRLRDARDSRTILAKGANVGCASKILFRIVMICRSIDLFIGRRCTRANCR